MKLFELFQQPASVKPKPGDTIRYYGTAIERPRRVEYVQGIVVAVDGPSLTFEVPSGKLFGVHTKDCRVVPNLHHNFDLEPIVHRNQRYGPK